MDRFESLRQLIESREAVVGIIGFIVSFLIGRGISRPVVAMSAAMYRPRFPAAFANPVMALPSRSSAIDPRRIDPRTTTPPSAPYTSA